MSSAKVLFGDFSQVRRGRSGSGLEAEGPLALRATAYSLTGAFSPVCPTTGRGLSTGQARSGTH